MKDYMTQQNYNKAYEHLVNVISSELFLKGKGPINEIPFYVCPYEPSITVPVKKLQTQLANTLEQKGIGVLNINLYDLTVDILKRENDWQWYISHEKSMKKTALKEDLQAILDVESVIIPEIATKMREHPYDVLFLTGIGEVFPYIRSHQVLNNLESTAKEKPTLMFFPGTYAYTQEKGASLTLFGELLDDRYYRASNIFKCYV